MAQRSHWCESLGYKTFDRIIADSPYPQIILLARQQLIGLTRLGLKIAINWNRLSNKTQDLSIYLVFSLFYITKMPVSIAGALVLRLLSLSVTDFQINSPICQNILYIYSLFYVT